ncbi:MAG: hypothetical protein PW792_07930 [Acidobacteriaceae bacterium]|nr:hypothetical protein [Acidobacteriaceae bacterium]
MASVQGVIHGGPNPIVGGRVRLWQTNTTASGATYGSQAIELSAGQTVTTSASGSFSFDNTNYPYTCTSGQYAYITVTGGNTGATGTNVNSVHMAVLGPCTSLSTDAQKSATRIFMSEASTVATAYALSNFISEDPSHLGDGDQRVWVNAPTTNNDPTGSCSLTAGVTTSCTGAGLAHAFQNAVNLVDMISFTGSMPTGAARSTLPANASASVPAALVNTLANAIQSCVNSTGLSSTGDTTSCSLLFGYTTLPDSYPTPTGIPAAPTDTLMAMVNLAKHPTGYDTSSVANIYLLTPSVGAGFAPALTKKPTDFSMGILYPASTVGSTASTFNGVFSVSLDAAGTVYTSDTLGTSGTANRVFSLSAGGTGNWVSSTAATFYNAKHIATDTAGHVWLANDGSTVATAHINCFNTADGSSCTDISKSSTPYPYYAWALSVDRSNNVWIGSATTNANYYQLWQTPAGSATPATMSGIQKQNVEGMAFDSNQNLWIGYYSSTSTANSTSAYLPKAATGYGTYTEFTLPSPASGSTYYVKGVAVDGSNRPVFAAKSAVATLTPSFDSNGYVTGIASSTSLATSGAYPTMNQVDGQGVEWNGYDTTSGVTIYATMNGTANFLSLAPCQLASAAATCATSISDPDAIAIDDAGTLWVGYGASGAAGLIQVIGTAAPTWSQLSYGHPGTMP